MTPCNNINERCRKNKFKSKVNCGGTSVNISSSIPTTNYVSCCKGTTFTSDPWGGLEPEHPQPQPPPTILKCCGEAAYPNKMTAVVTSADEDCAIFNTEVIIEYVGDGIWRGHTPITQHLRLNIELRCDENTWRAFYNVLTIGQGLSLLCSENNKRVDINCTTFTGSVTMKVKSETSSEICPRCGGGPNDTITITFNEL